MKSKPVTKSKLSKGIGNLVLSIADQGIRKSSFMTIYEIKVPKELKEQNNK